MMKGSFTQDGNLNISSMFPSFVGITILKGFLSMFIKTVLEYSSIRTKCKDPESGKLSSMFLSMTECVIFFPQRTIFVFFKA